jgi:hypothetical protein
LVARATVAGKEYFSALQPDWSIAARESQPFGAFIDGQANEGCNGSKSEGEGFQEAHPGRQKVGQACGWQEVAENCKHVSREETTEARDQPETLKPTHTRSVVIRLESRSAVVSALVFS